jgi:hypothetical protein
MQFANTAAFCGITKLGCGAECTPERDDVDNLLFEPGENKSKIEKEVEEKKSNENSSLEAEQEFEAMESRIDDEMDQEVFELIN